MQGVRKEPIVKFVYPLETFYISLSDAEFHFGLFLTSYEYAPVNVLLLLW
jgi:hypothetical protein